MARTVEDRLVPPLLIDQIDALIRRDPAGRGLISSESRFGPLCPGHLAKAAENLANTVRAATIVTGFFVPDAQPPTAETDGPPGALLLATALESLGAHVTIVTDEFCARALRAAARAVRFDESKLAICPSGNAATRWVDAYFGTSLGNKLTHLIAIERVGASHDEKSLAQQFRADTVPLADFRAQVASANQNRRHNMRGAVIDEWTVPLDWLFERGPQLRPNLKTIGIGDGGNEVGMGTIPWEELARRLAGHGAAANLSACIPCRIATDWNIVAGTSNWGAFALAAATLSLAGRTEALEPWTEEFHRVLLERMVVDGPAVDGITRRAEATVDGLPFATYIQIWIGIRRLIGLHDQ